MKRNLKPFIYIGLGIVLCVTLYYFKTITDKVEHRTGIDILMPLSTTNDSIQHKNSVVVKIKKDLNVYIDDIQHNIIDIERVLLDKAVNDSLIVILQAEKSVPVAHMIDVMEIANTHKFKVIMAVKPVDE
ncbi:ExbD/TolR family protein [Psychroserpens luteolus]|uniref:ExbD/TolR family protein n=1 Tax=Psychroserpens luteolus TaxID=2855840 RepID=UPI001E5AEB70|nr:biopolymer transporter ExbD [Psychroserpens luteolus]MCD2259728.1 biopolymer transporter ExbD [Psychroserpens luteolus]